MEKLSKLTALLAVIGAVCIAVLWVIFFATGYMKWDEMAKDVSRIFLLGAETVTAGVLLASGVGSLMGRDWARKMLRYALGMLLYAVIFGLGEFIQRNNAFLIALFSFVIAAASVLIVLDLLAKSPNEAKK